MGLFINMSAELEYEENGNSGTSPPLTPIPLLDPLESDDEDADTIGRKSKKSKHAPFVWKDDLVYFLIDRWSEEPCLYNVKDPLYHDKNKRNLTFERLLTTLEDSEYNPVPSKKDVLDKINTLRSYYNTQRKKVKKSEESGTSSDKVYKPRWQFFDRLSFLCDNVTPRRTFSNLDDNPADQEDLLMRDGDGQQTSAPKTPLAAFPPGLAKGMRKKSNTITASSS